MKSPGSKSNRQADAASLERLYIRRRKVGLGLANKER
eukprot:COSAG06_NODE_65160_length_257_cov_1.715190_1_plen_37_part_01